MGEITVSINPFVPKPWSTFQWEAMAEEKIITQRLKKIRSGLQREANIKVVHSTAKAAYFQALFARGDRRVLPFLLGQAETKRNWKKMVQASSVDPDMFVYRVRGKDELFPWDFIDHGISKGTLYKDYQEFLAQVGS